MEHWTKKFLEKFTPKHVQNTFGHFWNDFGHLRNFGFFESIFHGKLVKKILKNLPQNTFKTIFDTFGILGIFGKTF